MKKAVLFHLGIASVGGGERLTQEHLKYFAERGFETVLLCYKYGEICNFDGYYRPRVEIIGERGFLGRFSVGILLYRVFALRRFLRKFKPDFLVAGGPGECIYLYWATMGLGVKYSTYVHQTFFWEDTRINECRYSRLFRRVYDEVLDSVPGHREFCPERPRKMGFLKRIEIEFTAWSMTRGLRKAIAVYTLSSHMQWEVKKLFDADALEVKGAFPRNVLDYRGRVDIREKHALGSGPILLSVSRLARKKRIDMLIRAFSHVARVNPEVMLVIVGFGPDEGRLRDLARSEAVDGRVVFTGFVHDEELLDYYQQCDIFLFSDHADFGLAPYVALAFQKKAVWSVESVPDPYLGGNPNIFQAFPEKGAFAEAILKALAFEGVFFPVERYTWEAYFERIADIHRERAVLKA